MKKPLVTVPPETMDGLLKYSWPGNVRELENLLKRALLLSKSNVITPDLISAEINSTIAVVPGNNANDLSALIPDNMSDYEGHLFKHVIDQVEKELVEKALAFTKGNQVKTAKLLGISRAMLHERMEKFGLLPE
jgi:DNA-binding NtrC family response regulator